MWKSDTQKEKLGASGPVVCYNCGSKAMTLKRGICRMSDGVKVPDVEFLECQKCGEKLFDGFNTDKVVNYRRSLEKSSRRGKPSRRLRDFSKT